MILPSVFLVLVNVTICLVFFSLFNLVIFYWTWFGWPSSNWFPSGLVIKAPGYQCLHPSETLLLSFLTNPSWTYPTPRTRTLRERVGRHEVEETGCPAPAWHWVIGTNTGTPSGLVHKEMAPSRFWVNSCAALGLITSGFFPSVTFCKYSHMCHQNMFNKSSTTI
jgi:hypothetical protein